MAYGKKQRPPSPGQLELPHGAGSAEPARGAEALERELEAQSGYRVSLTLTDNTSTMLSMKRNRARKAASLRLHRMFLTAPKAVVGALADWVAAPDRFRGGAVLDGYIDANRERIRGRRVGEARQTKGQVYDLDELFAEVNATEFGEEVVAAITWGRMPAARRRRSIRFGSYTPDDHLIRIHPLLDQASVPRFFIRYIVFHEMLHAVIGISRGPSGRRQIHTNAFKARERAYPDYARAVAWLNDPANLARLLK